MTDLFGLSTLDVEGAGSEPARSSTYAMALRLSHGSLEWSFGRRELLVGFWPGGPGWWHTRQEMEVANDANSGRAAAAVAAIQTGNIDSLRRLLEDAPGLVNERIDGQRTLLHVATDWPGNFPNNAATVAMLMASGAAVNSPFIGTHSETPLHWAASCNDVGVVDVLLDHGADLEAQGGVIGDGTPLADAVAFGQWEAARRLVERGALTTLWQAAALGLMDRVMPYFATDSPPSLAEINTAFWSACSGGQQLTAGFLLDCGADLNWVGYDGLTPLDVASRNGAKSVVIWLRGKGAKSATTVHCSYPDFC